MVSSVLVAKPPIFSILAWLREHILSNILSIVAGDAGNIHNTISIVAGIKNHIYRHPYFVHTMRPQMAREAPRACTGIGNPTVSSLSASPMAATRARASYGMKVSRSLAFNCFPHGRKRFHET